MVWFAAALSVLLAAAALGTSLRTRRHVRRLAKALARQWGLRTGAGAGGGSGFSPESAGSTQDVAPLRAALQSLEERVRELAVQHALAQAPSPARATGSGTAAPGGLEPRERVRAHLIGLGYTEIVLLPGSVGATAFLYEAREEGMPRKGSARLGPDGRVLLQPAAAARVFP